MPLTRAKAPISSSNRKSLSPTTVQTKKRTSQKNSQVDGSYLQVGSDNVTVSPQSHTFTSVSQASGASDPNQAILSALTRWRRLIRISPIVWREWRWQLTPTPFLYSRPDPERQKALTCPRDPDWIGIPPQLPLRELTRKYHMLVGERRFLLLINPYPMHLTQISLAYCHTVLPLHTLKPWKPVGMPSFHQWMLLEVSQASRRLLAQYEDQTHHGIVLGKDFISKTSGRYNTTDMYC